MRVFRISVVHYNEVDTPVVAWLTLIILSLSSFSSPQVFRLRLVEQAIKRTASSGGFTP